MDILPDIEAQGLGLHLKKHHVLVLADLHIGIEESLRRSGVLVPRQHFKEVAKRIMRILASVKGVKTIVLNGDLKHEFGSITDQEWREIKRLFDVIAQGGREVIVVKGNHDVMLGPIAKDKAVRIVKELVLDDTIIIHGDALPSSLEGIKSVIIGHEHPTIMLKDKAKAEKFKCFLLAKYKRRNLIVQPSFGPLTEGIDIRHGEFLSPLLGTNVRKSRVFVVDEENDEVLDFGAVSKL